MGVTGKKKGGLGDVWSKLSDPWPAITYVIIVLHQPSGHRHDRSFTWRSLIGIAVILILTSMQQNTVACKLNTHAVTIQLAVNSTSHLINIIFQKALNTHLIYYYYTVKLHSKSVI